MCMFKRLQTEAIGRGGYEAASPQSQHHPAHSQGRHDDCRRVPRLQENSYAASHFFRKQLVYRSLQPQQEALCSPSFSLALVENSGRATSLFDLDFRWA